MAIEALSALTIEEYTSPQGCGAGTESACFALRQMGMGEAECLLAGDGRAANVASIILGRQMNIDPVDGIPWCPKGVISGSKKAEQPKPTIGEFPMSVVGYIDFLNFELDETRGACRFQIHHPAPEDMTKDHLEIIADNLRKKGWIADVAPIEREGVTLFGVRIRSHVDPEIEE